MNPTIRKAEPKDVQGVAKVHVETWQSHYKGQVPDGYLSNLSVEKRAKSWFESLSNPKPNKATFVAEIDGKVVGFCSVGPSRDNPDLDQTGELYAIYIDPAIQGMGTGSALMKACLNFLRDQGFKKATLWVLDTNESTINFYKSKGWLADGEEKKEEISGKIITEIRFAKELSGETYPKSP